MEQLLSIKHIPIKIEVNVTNAQLKPREEDPLAPSVKISKGSDGVRVAAQPYKVDISTPKLDSYVPSPVQQSALTLTYDAVAKISGSENASGAAEAVNTPVSRGTSQSIDAILSRLPKSKESSISYNDGTLSINYSMIDSESSSDIGSIADLKNGFEFIPGSIEFIVSQMPDLEIEYLGDPLYFPRSADPNYKGEVDVIA
ncbi:MAG: hypothetical protein ACI4I2_03195 [Oscillospiraceae bacterium]